ncbi:uncharacterized protein [Dysidea avara]|uniref:uncharacterized protein n=1 Tax=Dysidea avara TaxID=196820 RepID=UPI00332D1215
MDNPISPKTEIWSTYELRALSVELQETQVEIRATICTYMQFWISRRLKQPTVKSGLAKFRPHKLSSAGDNTTEYPEITRNFRYWQAVPIFDCSWKKRMLGITGPCTGLDKVVSAM